MTAADSTTTDSTTDDSTTDDSTTAPLLEIDDLVVETSGPVGPVRLIDHLSLTVAEHEVLCIVGESGSGKSLTLLGIMGLLPRGVHAVSGSIRLRGQELVGLPHARMRELRGRSVAIVFQDPMTSFNPVLRIGRQLREALRLHRKDLSRRDCRERVIEMLDHVGIADAASSYRAYPHELSGGMRQRAMIAMATAHDPALLLADEPTTALDVTVQAKVLGVLREMRARAGSAMVLVTHDLGVVAENADRVMVMYSGAVVESGTLAQVFGAPSHPYTIGLLAAALHLDEDVEIPYAIPGQPPAPADRPTGCAFAPRCGLSRGREICTTRRPPLQTDPDGHSHACWFSDEAGRAGDRSRAETGREAIDV